MSEHTLRIGDACTFYHEGGTGDAHWVRGWRHGKVRALPTKGRKKGWAEIELPAKLYAIDESVPGKRRRVQRPNERAWCHLSAVNQVGDTTYHGATLVEAVLERKEKKAADQANADKRKRKVTPRSSTRAAK